MIHKNAVTDFCEKEYTPEIHASAFIHPAASIIGHVFIGRKVMVSPFASVRGDEGHPIIIGDDSNLQDGVVIHALETEHMGRSVEENLVATHGKKAAVHLGERVSVAHQAQLHGPVSIGDDTFVGMMSLVFRAGVGRNCVIEPGCLVMGVQIDDRRYVPAGTVVKDQKNADKLPLITDDYPFKDMNRNVVRVNTNLASGYNRMDLPSPDFSRRPDNVETY
jgi:carbonic anhydrase/acetyltransferase-like protein (isoleucine patch superfamily)